MTVKKWCLFLLYVLPFRIHSFHTVIFVRRRIRVCFFFHRIPCYVSDFNVPLKLGTLPNSLKCLEDE